MEKIIEFDVNKSKVDVVKATKDYFLNQGFKQEFVSEDRLVFTRGSILKNMVTFNPLSWKSTSSIEFQESRVIATFNIVTTGQAVTKREEELWDNFIENYKKSIDSNFDYQLVNSKLLKDTKIKNLKYIVSAIKGALIVGIPASFIAYYAEMGIIASLGAAVGAVLFMMYKIEKDKKNAI